MKKTVLISDNNYSMRCINCATYHNLSLVPHRIGMHVVGILVCCPGCAGDLVNAELKIEIETESNDYNT